MLKAILAFLLIAAPSPLAQKNDLFHVNGGKPLPDAHNCYPYDGKWANRIDRALSIGFPVAIEQDIAPYVDPATGVVTAKVTHRERATAQDPALRDHFFERVRPIIERALREKKKDRWPLIVLHFDFKDNTRPTLEAVWKLLGEYQGWITTGKKTASPSDLSHFDWKPILVLTEDNDNQEQVFFNDLPVGATMRLFGSAHTNQKITAGLSGAQRNHVLATASPEQLLPTEVTNYRRWWNNSWYEVEEGGQPHAGDWTTQDNARLQSLVNWAHHQGYWIRFYTLDGFTAQEDQGWGADYNFGSLQAVKLRWKAAMDAGVDMIASDQYELLGDARKGH